MERPFHSTKAESIYQWTYEGSRTVLDKLNNSRKEYNSARSLICVALFINIKRRYTVYFSTSSTHQLLSDDETINYLPIYRIDPNDLKFIDCGRNNCYLSISSYEEIWCRSCCGEFEAGELIQRFIRLPIFEDIPDSCILLIEVTENEVETKQLEIAWIHKKIAILEKDVNFGGKYDLNIEKHTKKVEEQRNGDRRRIEELKVQLREYS